MGQVGANPLVRVERREEAGRRGEGNERRQEEEAQGLS